MAGAWKDHAEVEEVLWIQARNKSDVRDEQVFVSSDDEATADERKEESGDSESGDDSDVEFDDDEDEASGPEIAASNKFALLGEEE